MGDILHKALPIVNPALLGERKLIPSSSQGIEEENLKHTLDFNIMKSSQIPEAPNFSQNCILESQEIFQQSPDNYSITPMLSRPEEAEHPSESDGHLQLFKQT
eukprot:TRINITY_DN15880_c0_g1_i2.p2 TRINITY_DN15880_c0_g1~~TRINITY_DN15880_c0_g1_i2.p2  ORF type:complete len:103 (-),score=12.12 TRINITY_DN15880_c0_g1_i2:263-571(-)